MQERVAVIVAEIEWQKVFLVSKHVPLDRFNPLTPSGGFNWYRMAVIMKFSKIMKLF